MTSNAADPRKPPIVLIHGLWMTPLSWEGWGERFRAPGHEVLTPPWPGQDGTPEELRRDPEPIARQGNFRDHGRAPLLFIAGGADQVVPASVNRTNYRKYASSGAVTDIKEYPARSHFTCGEPGWQEVADYALDWAQ